MFAGTHGCCCDVRSCCARAKRSRVELTCFVIAYADTSDSSKLRLHRDVRLRQQLRVIRQHLISHARMEETQVHLDVEAGGLLQLGSQQGCHTGPPLMSVGRFRMKFWRAR